LKRNIGFKGSYIAGALVVMCQGTGRLLNPPSYDGGYREKSGSRRRESADKSPYEFTSDHGIIFCLAVVAIRDDGVSG